jgi:hypothetical protein
MIRSTDKNCKKSSVEKFETTIRLPPKLQRRVRSRVARLVRRLDKMEADPSKWNMSDINFVLFRMLTAIPFSAKIATTTVLGRDMPKMPLTLRLGEVFDATVLQNRYMKPVANLIAKWATEHIASFARLRGQQLSTIY